MKAIFFISKFRNLTVGKAKIIENHEKPASQAHPYYNDRSSDKIKITFGLVLV